MADLAIRDIPEPLWRALESLAQAERLPVEEEARRLLARALNSPLGLVGTAAVGEALRQLERFRLGLVLPPGTPDSAELLREDRAR
jgi:plasmid stability protein